MTEALLSSRKRVRSSSCEEDCCDFMPLSKRINNLRINNVNCCNSIGYQHLKHPVTKQDTLFEPGSDEWGCMEPSGEYLKLNGNELLCHHSYQSGNDCDAALQSTCSANSGIPGHPEQPLEVSGSRQCLHPNSWMTNQILSQYSPDLDASENPYYYESNKLLFALYMERLHRNGSTLY
ncbi:hypothetical protein B7P43_G04981 [Cryptotermes secundus]|uniref:Uncharacterized protein n=1 Tax=Cryptotermes secundus TaxID=105785 RepID=A0A2J7PLW9_9NEOP|nr:uncharacterized protein LOC111873128 isoform X2 [Cryptotermes secundus]PNF17322.1 hypothetical protein B7P43_G04981 [Cryptotermes secundus]